MGEDKPNPLTDTLKGLGLLFRAARTVAAKIPTKNLEEVVTTSAREVGRAFENVATTIERGVLGKDSPFARSSREEPPAHPVPHAPETPEAPAAKDVDSPDTKHPG
jgi:hypothetical protein